MLDVAPAGSAHRWTHPPAPVRRAGIRSVAVELPDWRITIEHHGNASAATIPLALTIALEDGRLRDGANVLLCAFGLGLTWGAGVVRWGTARA